MSKMTIIVALIIVSLIATNLIRGYSNITLGTPEYELVKESGSYEIRKYGPMIMPEKRKSIAIQYRITF